MAQSQPFLLSSMGAGSRPGNLFDKNEMIAATEGCDAILHLHTKIPRKREDPKDWRKTIVSERRADNLTRRHPPQMRLTCSKAYFFIYGDQQAG